MTDLSADIVQVIQASTELERANRLAGIKEHLAEIIRDIPRYQVWTDRNGYERAEEVTFADWMKARDVQTLAAKIVSTFESEGYWS